MLTLVLVEDEIHTANLIKNAIEWDKLNIGSCEVFYDGLSAYNFILEHSVDIIITDIKMPLMDGMTLIEKCHEANCKALFIIMSGYRDFQYAYKAIKYEVFDYILKPIQSSSLIDVLQKAVDKITASRGLASIPPKSSRISADIQKLCAGIFFNASGSLANMHEESPGIPEYLLSNPCVLINLNFMNFDDFISNHWKYSVSQFKNAVINITSFETPELCFVSLNFLFDEIFILAISKKDADNFDENLLKYIDSVKKNFMEIFSLDADLSIVSQVSTLNQLIKSFREEKNSAALDENIIEKCKTYVYNNLNKQITLSDLAEHVYLSPIYLSSYFKEKTGENFSSYLKNVRIERSKQLLLQNNLSVSQICEAIGFKSESYFYKLFKNTVGITPQQYKEQKGE